MPKRAKIDVDESAFLLPDAVLGIDEVEQLCQQPISVSEIGFVPTTTQGLEGIMEMARCMQHCQNWLQESLLSIGWKENRTGLDALAGHSISEIMQNTVDCFQEACRQRVRVAKGT